MKQGESVKTGTPRLTKAQIISAKIMDLYESRQVAGYDAPAFQEIVDLVESRAAAPPVVGTPQKDQWRAIKRQCIVCLQEHECTTCQPSVSAATPEYWCIHCEQNVDAQHDCLAAAPVSVEPLMSADEWLSSDANKCLGPGPERQWVPKRYWDADTADAYALYHTDWHDRKRDA